MVSSRCGALLPEDGFKPCDVSPDRSQDGVVPRLSKADLVPDSIRLFTKGADLVLHLSCR